MESLKKIKKLSNNNYLKTKYTIGDTILFVSNRKLKNTKQKQIKQTN